MRIDIQELVARVLSSRRISLPEKQLMSSLLHEDNLPDEDKTLIERVFYGVRHGILQVVD
ncbi:MAG: hypothetical protein WA865_20295 [Spirulinaceae cyanobacterium]